MDKGKDTVRRINNQEGRMEPKTVVSTQPHTRSQYTEIMASNQSPPPPFQFSLHSNPARSFTCVPDIHHHATRWFIHKQTKDEIPTAMNELVSETPTLRQKVYDGLSKGCKAKNERK